MQFDGSWSISLAPGSAPPAAPEGWPALANGQIAIVPTLDATSGVDSLRSSVAIPPAMGYGRALPGFHSTRVRVALMPPPGSPATATPTPVSQAFDGTHLSLDMYRAALSVGCGTAVAVGHELRVLMQLPGCTLHTITVVVPAGLAPPGVGATLRVQHEMRAPQSAPRSREVEKNKKTAFAGESLSTAAGSFFALTGTAESACVGEDGQEIAAEVACAATYLVECTNSASVGLALPAPAYSEQRGRRAVATFYVSAAPSPTTSSPTTLRFHVLTSVATSLDSAAAGAGPSALRTLLAAASTAAASGPAAAAVASSLIAAHEAAWAKRWNTFVDVSGADNRVRWALMYAAYNLHACTRPLGPAVDLAGTSLAGGRADDFVGTLMTLFAHESARAALEARWASIEVAAKTLAADAGLPGARFPYAGELDGDEYGDGDEDEASLQAQDEASATAAAQGYASAWSASAAGLPVRLHATSMAAVSAWNYFRVTQDGEWLAKRGYPILKAAADLLSAYCVLPDPVGSPNAYRLPATVGVDVQRPPNTDPAYEVAAVVAAMRGAIEAAYQLGFAPPQAWSAVRYGLALPTVPGSPLVLASDGGGPTPIGYPAVAGSVAAQSALPAGSGPLAIAEPLLVFAEPVASLADALALNPGALPTNLAYWSSAAQRSSSAAFAASPPLTLAIGDLVVLNATAQAAQLGGSVGVAQAASFQTQLDSILDRHSDLGPAQLGGSGGGWGNLRPDGGPAAAPNDLGLSSLVLLSFVQGLAGALIQGGITQAQFVYSSLGINTATTSCLPTGWASITVHGLGPARVDVVLLNNLGGDGGAGASYTSWSVSALTS